MAGQNDNLAQILNNAPELQHNPGLTVGLANGLDASGAPVDPAVVGQSASIGLISQGTQQAQQDITQHADPVAQQEHHSSGGLFHSIGHFVGSVAHGAEHVAGDVVHGAEHVVVNDVVHPMANVLSYGLNEVTHTYRYIHDVWERHGVLAALGEMAIVGVGAAIAATGVGAIAEAGIATGAAAILGGEVAGNVAARLGYKDSWNATADTGYTDAQGYKVSPGRDFARLLGHVIPGFDVGHDAQGNITGTGAGFVSGATDATFDLSFDPALKLGVLVKGARVAARVPKLAKTWEEVKGGEELAARPIVEQNGILPNNVQVLYRQSPAVRDAFDRIGSMDTDQILRQYPQLPAGMVKALGQAHNGQEVADVFEQSLTAYNYSFQKYGLPATSLTRRLLGGVGLNVPTPAGMATALTDREKLGPFRVTRQATDSNGNPLFFHVDGMPTQIPIMTPAGALGHTINAFTAYQPFAFNSKTLEISGRSGDPMDPEFLRGLYSVLRYSQNAATAKSILARYIESDTLAEKINVITNGYRDALRASGLPDTHEFAGRVVGDLGFMTKQALHGRFYAVDREGKRIALVDDNGNVLNRGIWVNQTGKVAFPDFNTWRRAVAETKGGPWATAIHVDDWMNRNLTTRYFKRLVLLSLGFALRVGSGELIPASLSQGARKVLSGGIASAAAKLNPDVAEIMGTVARDATGAHPLIGARAATKGIRHIGVIKDFSPDTGEAMVSFAGEEPTAVAAHKLTVFHADIEDQEIRDAAEALGIKFTSDELPHIRAAVGKALWGVSKAFIDPVYREVALMNILANEGHIVAPGIASMDFEPRGIRPINSEVRRAASKIGINMPGNKALGKDFRLWDSGDENHPLFWKYALTEAAADPGARAIARAYARSAAGQDIPLEDIVREMEQGGGGTTFDLRTGKAQRKGYAFAAHPAHETKIPLADYSPARLAKFIHDKLPHLLQDGHYLGVWEEDGQKFLDVSRVTNSLKQAKRLASERGELSVADLAKISKGDFDNAFHSLSYSSEEERQRIRREFARANPIGDRPVSPGAEGLLRGHGSDTGGSDTAGPGQGSPEGGGRPAHVRLTPEQEARATQAAIKADRAWLESDDPVAIRARAEMAHYFRDPERYSALRVEGIKGLVHGQNGHVNLDVLDSLARGESHPLHELAEKTYNERPLAVKGRTLESVPELGTVDRLVGAAWRPIHEVINGLSRAPIWTTIVTDEYKAFKPWIDAGYMTKADAHGIAQVRALNRMLPLIHNPLLRNKFALSVRNVYPFYFAQEQAYKRYGRAMYSNPIAFREAQLVMHGLHASGALQSDAQGNSHIVIPGAGSMSFLTTLALSHMGLNVLGGVPSQVSGNTISLRSVVPEFIGPGVAPTVAIPMKEIAKAFPSTDPFVKWFLGDVSYNSSLWDEAIPNTTLRRMLEAADVVDRQRVFGSTFAQNAAWAAHKALPLWQRAEAIDSRATDGVTPRSELNPHAAKLLAKADRYVPLPGADPHDKQIAMDRLNNTTKIQLLVKAAIGLLSPLAPTMEVGDVKLHKEMQDLLSQYGVQKGLQVFSDRHPDATPDTVFQSDSSALGTTPPATGAALDWIEQNKGWVGSNQLAAAYLIPQSKGAFSMDAYTQELALHLRQKRSPEQFLDAIYTAEGNAQFFPSLQSYEAQKQAAQQSGDTATADQLGTAWNQYVQDLARRNPIWYANELDDKKKQATAIAAYGQLSQALASPDTPHTPMLGVVQQLVNDYQSFEQQMALARAGAGQFSQTTLKNNWSDYLDQFAAQNPEAQAVVYGVFKPLGAIG